MEPISQKQDPSSLNVSSAPSTPVRERWRGLRPFFESGEDSGNSSEEDTNVGALNIPKWLKYPGSETRSKARSKLQPGVIFRGKQMNHKQKKTEDSRLSATTTSFANAPTPNTGSMRRALQKSEQKDIKSVLTTPMEQPKVKKGRSEGSRSTREDSSVITSPLRGEREDVQRSPFKSPTLVDPKCSMIIRPYEKGSFKLRSIASQVPS